MAPETLDIEYQIELSDADCELIGMQGIEDVVVVVIVYRDEAQSGRIAANARSPVILNLKNRKGMQKVLQNVHPTLLYRARWLAEAEHRLAEILLAIWHQKGMQST